MGIGKRLVLFTILFAIISFILLAIIPRRLVPEYGISVVKGLDFSDPGKLTAGASRQTVGSGDVAAGHHRGEYAHGRVPLPLTAVAARQGDFVGVVTSDDAFVLRTGSYNEIGKTMAAGEDRETGVLTVLDRSGETVEYPDASRVVLFDSEILLLRDDGRQIADVSRGVDAAPRWTSVPAPITAAVAIDNRVIVGDAIGTVSAYSDGERHWSFEMPGSGHPTVIALGAGPDPERLYAVGGVEPTSIARFDIGSGDPALKVLNALDEDLRSPIHLLVSRDGPIIGSGQSIHVYGTDLDARARVEVNGSVETLGFAEEKNLIYVIVTVGDRHRLEFRYADTLERMYTIDFADVLHSTQSSGSYYAFGTEDRVLLYTEFRP